MKNTDLGRPRRPAETAALEKSAPIVQPPEFFSPNHQSTRREIDFFFRSYLATIKKYLQRFIRKTLRIHTERERES